MAVQNGSIRQLYTVVNQLYLISAFFYIYIVNQFLTSVCISWILVFNFCIHKIYFTVSFDFIRNGYQSETYVLSKKKKK